MSHNFERSRHVRSCSYGHIVCHYACRSQHRALGLSERPRVVDYLLNLGHLLLGLYRVRLFAGSTNVHV